MFVCLHVLHVWLATSPATCTLPLIFMVTSSFEKLMDIITYKNIDKQSPTVIDTYVHFGLQLITHACFGGKNENPEKPKTCKPSKNMQTLYRKTRHQLQLGTCGLWGRCANHYSIVLRDGWIIDPWFLFCLVLGFFCGDNQIEMETDWIVVELIKWARDSVDFQCTSLINLYRVLLVLSYSLCGCCL